MLSSSMPSLLKIKAIIYLFFISSFYNFYWYFWKTHLDHNIVKGMLSFSMPSLLKIKAIIYLFLFLLFIIFIGIFEEHILTIILSRICTLFMVVSFRGTHFPAKALLWIQYTHWNTLTLLSSCSELCQCDT